MIGNDIVDLKLASKESNWQRNGFLNKVFTKEEQGIILISNNPFRTVWLLWTMKESAYKIYVQQTSKRFFNPKKMSCDLINHNNGFVQINNIKYQTKSQITDHFIHTVAVINTTKNTDDFCFEVKNNSYLEQHNNCYKRVKLVTSKRYHYNFEEIQIKKNNLGVPKIYHQHKKLSDFLSISHHGKFGSFALMN
jgi:phosphopantetheinyl transferase (holo-ACP synthase)